MAISSKHPEYSHYRKDWQKTSDAYAGEDAIKARGTEYLPATTGQILDGQPDGSQTVGGMAYEAYKKRAVYHEFVKDAVEKNVGVMHSKPPVIELPPGMENMLDSATVDGEGLAQLLRRINEAQLVNGRIGLLLDLPATPSDNLPLYIATYSAQNIINWDTGSSLDGTGHTLNLVVLDESQQVRTAGSFSWTKQEQYRLLTLGDPGEDGGTYLYGVFDSDISDIPVGSLEAPSIRGKTLDKVPFVFVNSIDMLASPAKPPLAGLANLALTVYRGEADYRQSLFAQGQDTLITKGLDSDSRETVRTGVGAAIHLPIDGDASFIGVDSTGLEEQRLAIENDKKEAAQKGAQLLDSTSRNVESGDALRIRTAAQTATLNEIALTGAAALQKLLRLAAEWLGLDPEQVVVKPNLDFAEDELIGAEFKTIMEAKAMGLPLSLRSVHSTLQDRGLTEMEFDDEIAEIEKEDIPPEGTSEGDDPQETEDFDDE